MVGHYRTRHNGAMHRLFFVIGIACLAALPTLAHAWSAAGHRLAAVIAWQQMSPTTRGIVADALGRHPDYPHWAQKARGSAAGIFAEAAAWPDSIRNDPRFFDEGRDPPTPPLPGIADTARHKSWHYVDLDERGVVTHGQLDSQIERLVAVLRSTGRKSEMTHALPWLAHLVADIHQPLHVGRYDDRGGNAVEVDLPFSRRRSATRLHAYWDGLPGAASLRGARLAERARRLAGQHRPPEQGDVMRWRTESHALLVQAYPPRRGGAPAEITREFHQHAHEIADRRIAEAGYRLGRLLETALSVRPGD